MAAETPIRTSDPIHGEAFSRVLDEKTSFGTDGDWWMVEFTLEALTPIPPAWDPNVRHFRNDLVSEGVTEEDLEDALASLSPDEHLSEESDWLVPMGDGDYRVMDPTEIRLRTYEDRERLADPSTSLPHLDSARRMADDIKAKYAEDYRKKKAAA